MYLKTARIGIGITKSDLPLLERFIGCCDILSIMEFWDGGAREGCLFIRKKDDGYLLCEYIYPYFTHDPILYPQKLTNTRSAEALLKEIEAFCNARYGGIEHFDFTQLTQNQALCRFFGF